MNFRDFVIKELRGGPQPRRDLIKKFVYCNVSRLKRERLTIKFNDVLDEMESIIVYPIEVFADPIDYFTMTMCRLATPMELLSNQVIGRGEIT